MKWFTYILLCASCLSFSNCFLFKDEHPTLYPISYDLSDDTTVQKYLDALHGVWIRKGYFKTLADKGSLAFTNKVFGNSFVMLHIDKANFHEYYLPIIAKTPQDTALKKTFLYFEQEAEGVMLSVMTNHPLYKAAKTPFIAYLARGEMDFEIIIQAEGERIALLNDTYERLSLTLPSPNYLERPFASVEDFVKENIISGTYILLDADFQVVQKNLIFTPEGNVYPQEVLTRYTFWSSPSTDYLRFNLIGQDDHSYFGHKDYIVRISPQQLTLYESVKVPRQKEPTLVKRWILQRQKEQIQ